MNFVLRSALASQYASKFPAPGTHLHRYAQQVNCAEINSSFYRPHQKKIYERWADSTPAPFRFCVKAPKQITHDQRLADPHAILDRFADETAGLGKKLGAVLVQLAPSLAFDKTLAGNFFKALDQRISAPAVCEPRHASWFTPEVDAWLAKRRIAGVGADPARVPEAAEPGGWRGLSYFRLHGSPRMYYSAYTPAFIKTLSRRAKAQRVPVWCIFDNTAAGAALGDALSTMRQLAPAIT